MGRFGIACVMAGCFALLVWYGEWVHEPERWRRQTEERAEITARAHIERINRRDWRGAWRMVVPVARTVYGRRRAAFEESLRWAPLLLPGRLYWANLVAPQQWVWAVYFEGIVLDPATFVWAPVLIRYERLDSLPVYAYAPALLLPPGERPVQTAAATRRRAEPQGYSEAIGAVFPVRALVGMEEVRW